MFERIVLIDQPQKNILLDILGVLLVTGCSETRPIHQLPVFREKLLELLLIHPDLLGCGFRFHLSSLIRCRRPPICYRSRKKIRTRPPNCRERLFYLRKIWNLRVNYKRSAELGNLTWKSRMEGAISKSS